MHAEGTQRRASPMAGARRLRQAQLPNLIPEIDRLLWRIESPRVLLIAGTFDWLHNGHVSAFERAANARIPAGPAAQWEPVDLVVVLVNKATGRKTDSEKTFQARLRNVRAAVRDHPMLRDRVAVSDLLARYPGHVPELLERLVAAYPEVRFGACAGSDSAARAPLPPPDGYGPERFDRLRSNADVLIEIARPGLSTNSSSPFASLVLDEEGPDISSTRIREALERDSLDEISDAVPPSTWRALQREWARRRDIVDG